MTFWKNYLLKIHEILKFLVVFEITFQKSYFAYSAVVYEVERWPHTPVSVGSISAAETVFFYLLTTNEEVFISHEKHSGSESTLISRSF